MEEAFIGRQPILDRHGKIYAYELLFRSSSSQNNCTIDSDFATANVIVNALGQVGLKTLIGRAKGFINMTREILFSESVKLLPKDQIVLEILENITPDETLIAKCKELRGEGFMLALDDYEEIRSSEYAELFKLINVLKVDCMLNTPEQIEEIVERFRGSGVKLLVEKVETLEDFERYKALGFDLFQGYYFAKPAIISSQAINPNHMITMQLFVDFQQDAPIDKIADDFKRSLELSFQLLQLINSAGIGLTQKITTIQHAISLLGRQQLQRWIMITIFTNKDRKHSENPLFQTAVIRGRFMEILQRNITPYKSEEINMAFMTGLISLLDAATHIPKKELYKRLSINPLIIDAIEHHKGVLGTLLLLAELLEQKAYDKIDPILKKLSLKPATFIQAYNEALAWTMTFGSET
ncbi:MAG: EAL domain-containing protein [Campylobacterales bacterium]